MEDHEVDSGNGRRHFVVEKYFKNQLGGAQHRRSADRQAGYLLDYIQPHHSLLDVGCGPGSITRGFADLVPKGSVIGVDAKPDRIESALAQSPPSNVTFKVADVYDLPFDEGSFDVVHAHALLQHLHKPLPALAEMRRVLKPGGVIGIGDWDKSAVLLYPEDHILTNSLLWTQIVNDQANMHAGRQIAELLEEAGFQDPVMSVIAQGLSQKELVAFQVESLVRTFEDEDLKERIVEKGLATHSELNLLPDRWKEWGKKPGAIYVTHWFFGVAFR